MSKSITIQRYDNNIQLFFNIKNNGIVEPIHGARVYIKFIHSGTKEWFKREAEITDYELAECLYTLTRKDLSVTGTYNTEVETHYENGTILSTLSSPVTLNITPEIVDDKEEGFIPQKATEEESLYDKELFRRTGIYMRQKK